jgi:hypothetical protein
MTDSEVAHTVDIEAEGATVRAGETADITVTVENGSSESGEADVELAVDNRRVEGESVELDAGEATTVSFEWTPDADAVGTVELVAATETATAAETLTVEDAPAEFGVAIESADEHVSEGGTVTVTVDVTNEGTLAGTQKVEFRAGDTVEATRTLELDGGAGKRISFVHEVTAGDAPETTLTVASDDHEDDTSVPVVTQTVTPLRTLKSKGGMGPFGYLVFAGMLILLIPLLPLLVVLKLVDTLLGLGESVR